MSEGCAGGFQMRNVEEARLYFREGTRALAEAKRSASALWQAWGLLERDQVRPSTPDQPPLPQPKAPGSV